MKFLRLFLQEDCGALKLSCAIGGNLNSRGMAHEGAVAKLPARLLSQLHSIMKANLDFLFCNCDVWLSSVLLH